MRAAYLVRTCHYLGELALLLVLALDNGLDNGGMVGAQVDKDIPDAGLPKGLEESKRCCVSGEPSAGEYTFSRVCSPYTILAVLSFHDYCLT